MNLGEVLALHPHTQHLIIRDTAGNIEGTFSSALVDISILSCKVHDYFYKPSANEMYVTIEV